MSETPANSELDTNNEIVPICVEVNASNDDSNEGALQDSNGDTKNKSCFGWNFYEPLFYDNIMSSNETIDEKNHNY